MTAQKILKNIIKLSNRKASDPNIIPNETFKTCRKKIFPTIAELAKTCFKTKYFLGAFRETIIVVLRKNGKKDYSFSKNYRPIALENTLAKIIKEFIIDRITSVFKKHNFFSRTQIGARKKRATLTILSLLTTTVYSV